MIDICETYVVDVAIGSDGKDATLLVGKRKDGRMIITNTITGDAAVKLYEQLINAQR